MRDRFWWKGLTYNEAVSALHRGEMTQREWKRYKFAWTWCAARFEGEAAKAQDRYAERHGMEALWAFRNRVRAAVGHQPK